jgi:cell division protein FtsL
MVKSRNAKNGVRVNNAKSKRRRFRMTKRQIFMVLVILFISMGSGIGYVWSNFERTQIGYSLSQLQKEELRLREVNRKLRLELATLKSPQHLERLAVEKLGLKKPSVEQILLLP